MSIFSRFKRKKVVAKEATVASTAPAKPATKKAPAKAAAKPASKAPAKKAAAKKLNPQCAAMTAGGDQCRNSSRDGSKYCGSHKGYQPPTKGKVAAKSLDSKPAVKGAKDTKPAGRKKPDATASKDGYRPQCAALTAAGDQCKRSARDGSKYCGSHKGYRPPAKAATKSAKDTKPAVGKAKDTKPAARRTQVTRHGYGLYQSGNRYFFSKKAQKDVSGKPVYSMPKDRTVVRTPNGLPVLKKK